MSKYSVYSGSAVGTNYDTVILTEGRTTEAFASGEVAYLLREGCTVNETTWSGDVWGQNVDKAMPFDAYPVFSGDTVYRLSNGEGVTLGYSNDENKVIFCMDIVWGEPVFTYTDEEGWDNPETSTVTVKNTGNGQFTVTYAYVTDRTDITGSLRDEAGSPVTQLVLAPGENGTVRLLLEGEPEQALENTKISSLRLTIE